MKLAKWMSQTTSRGEWLKERPSADHTTPNSAAGEQASVIYVTPPKQAAK